MQWRDDTTLPSRGLWLLHARDRRRRAVHHDRDPGVSKSRRLSQPHVYDPCWAYELGRFAHQAAIAIARIKSSCRPVRAAYVLRPASVILRLKSFNSSFKLGASVSAAANFSRPSCMSASTVATSSDFETFQRCGPVQVISLPAVIDTRIGLKPRSSMRSDTARPTPLSSTTRSARCVLLSPQSGGRASRLMTCWITFGYDVPSATRSRWRTLN